jgi:hypothetical protein
MLKIIEKQNQIAKALEEKEDKQEITSAYLSFNSGANSLRDRKIKNLTIANYYTQIMENFIVGAKSYFLIARDLVDASLRLGESPFKELKKKLPISRSSIDKFIEIGKSAVCQKLYNGGNLPESWTTQYKIAVAPKDKNKDILNNVSATSTAREVQELVGVNKTNVFTRDSEHKLFEVYVDNSNGSYDSLFLYNLLLKLIDVKFDLYDTWDDQFKGIKIKSNLKTIKKFEEEDLKFKSESSQDSEWVRDLKESKDKLVLDGVLKNTELPI